MSKALEVEACDAALDAAMHLGLGGEGEYRMRLLGGHFDGGGEVEVAGLADERAELAALAHLLDDGVLIVGEEGAGVFQEEPLVDDAADGGEVGGGGDLVG
jgi:hypothetical protein